ncbi:hypothetical protein PENTCL1PPCAC_4857, partial [Pristionchus entomophagus]
EAFDRQFDYGKDTLLNFTLSASSLADDESVVLEIKNERGELRTYKYGTKSKEIRDSVYGNSLHLKTTVNDVASPSTYLRFIVK